MATTRIMPLHVGKGRKEKQAIRATIDYVSNPQKTDGGRLITSYQCDSRVADCEFALAKQQYIARTGRRRGKDDVIAYHVRQAFVPGEVTPEEANRLGVEFARRFTKENHAFIVCTHIDRAHAHNHIIWSAVDLSCTRKFRNFWGSTKAVRRLSDTICIENGLSVIENPKPHGKSYNKWLGDRAVPSHREQLRTALDRALLQNPDTLDSLLTLLEQDGFTVSRRGKSISVQAAGWKKKVRLNSLGSGYTQSDLAAALHKKTPACSPSPLSLLVDIQAKLRQGKGPGYERWAKVFNLKQLAQTVNYLIENNLLDYAALEEKAQAACAHHSELSGRIKALEARLQQISALRSHIIQYAKTRPVYEAYRKAGYSTKFLAAHEAEILLHKAAKQAFDESGLHKLPTVKALQAEYAAVLQEKRATYAAYRTARDEMRCVLTARANVERLLELPPSIEKEKSHDRE